MDRFEEFSGSLETENGMRLKAMVEMQNKLATWIGMGLEKSFWLKMLSRLMFVLAVLASIVAGAGAAVVLLRFGR